MSEEEIAIETLKEVASDDFDTLGDDISPKMAQNILNVIEKQQKEIEEKTTIIMAGAEKVKQLEKEIEKLKEKNKTLESLLQGNLYELYLYYKELASKYQANSISKDKIREKIKKAKEIKWHTPKLVIEYFEELLEEK